MNRTILLSDEFHHILIISKYSRCHRLVKKTSVLCTWPRTLVSVESLTRESQTQILSVRLFESHGQSEEDVLCSTWPESLIQGKVGLSRRD